MSLLSTSRLASRTTNLPPELVVACLHTSAACLFTSSPTNSYAAHRTSPSRTRLAKHLGSSGKLEVAPQIERESAPHIGRPAFNRPAPIKRLSTREEDFKRRNTRGIREEGWRRRNGYETQGQDWRSRHRYDSPGVGRDSLNTEGIREEGWRRRNAPQTEGQDSKSRYMHDSPKSPSGVGRDAFVSKPRTSNKPQIVNPLSDEFSVSKSVVSSAEIPTAFSSPPLTDDLLATLHQLLGPDARPTPIQGLSLKHLMKSTPDNPSQYHQYLLASETGSGKSIAYLLPMLQDLKQSEIDGTQRRSHDPSVPHRAMNPRAIILAPTHELSRQLSGFAKELLHQVKLRVLCASRANVSSRKPQTMDAFVEGENGELELTQEALHSSGRAHPVDVLVGTPSKVLELIRGRNWDYTPPEVFEDKDHRSHRKVTIGAPTMGLANVEWVVVDEADVLFDPDFQEATRMILSDISAARGHPIPFNPVLDLSDKVAPEPINYPFNFILTSATIPSSLAAYLDKFHPSLTRLASPHLHKLPRTLKTEHFSWTGGNRDADIEHRLRRVWFDDLQEGLRKSKVLVFCNKSTRVEVLGAYLREKGIANVALTSMSDARRHGSNHHLDGFMRVRETARRAPAVPLSPMSASMGDLQDVPHVLITTSLLSRGLDFAPDVKHVFIVDEPRNMVDFLHRAGRSGRAGENGKVVVFGKSKGRGSEKARVVKKKVGALTA